MAKQITIRTPSGTPTPTPIAVDLLDGDECSGVKVARVGKVLGDVEDTEMLDEAGGSFTDVEDVDLLEVEIVEMLEAEVVEMLEPEVVEMLEEMTEEDDIVASNGEVEVEPLNSASGLKRDPTAPSVKADSLQQLILVL